MSGDDTAESKGRLTAAERSHVARLRMARLYGRAPTDDRRVIADYRKPMTLAAVGQRHGISAVAVLKILRMHQIAMRGPGEHLPRGPYRKQTERRLEQQHQPASRPGRLIPSLSQSVGAANLPEVE